jgi:hypothetical protein
MRTHAMLPQLAVLLLLLLLGLPCVTYMRRRCTCHCSKPSRSGTSLHPPKDRGILLKQHMAACVHSLQHHHHRKHNSNAKHTARGTVALLHTHTVCLAQRGIAVTQNAQGG